MNKKFIDSVPFEVVSTKLIITVLHSQYSEFKWVEPVKNGIWKTTYKTQQDLISEIVVYHPDFELESLQWDGKGPCISINSGQMGMFDASKFRDVNFNVALENSPIKAVPYEIIASSGWNDGAYQSYIAKSGDAIVGIKITFIEEARNIEYNEF
jgi:hypothetical protein